MNAAADPYRAAALDQGWRLIAMLDRNPHSPTRGSFARTHWAWKFSDFPFPRLQEGLYALARLRTLDDPRNPLYRAEAAGTWIRWAFEYWISLQHANGAFDEAYPNEQCLAATAFTSFYVGHAYRLCRDELDPPLRSRVETALHRAGEWLCGHDETHGILSNHLAAAAAGLQLVAGLTADSTLSTRASVFLDRILAQQSAEGWLREYDGADIGYGTHAFFYLAVYWQMTGCTRTKASLERFAGFLAYFVHPDGTIGGEYASRDTEFYYPAGLEMFAAASPAAASIAVSLRQSIADRRVCGVWSMDTYNFMPMLNNLLFAIDAVDVAPPVAPLPWQQPPSAVRFDEAGLWVINKARFYAVVGLGKGGTVSVFDKAERRMTARHSGLIAHAGGKAFTTQLVRTSPYVQTHSDREIEIEVPWKSLETRVMSPVLFVAFRLFTLTLGRFDAVSRRVKQALVNVLIRRRTEPPFRQRRRISVLDDGIEIADDLVLPGASDVSAVEQFTSVHMGSALYADARTTAGAALPVTWAVPSSAPLRLRGRLTLDGTVWTMEGA